MVAVTLSNGHQKLFQRRIIAEIHRTVNLKRFTISRVFICKDSHVVGLISAVSDSGCNYWLFDCTSSVTNHTRYPAVKSKTLNVSVSGTCILNLTSIWHLPFDAHCCHMGTAIKHPVPDRVKPSFVIFDIRAL